jgi:hypothetical protein
MTPLLAFFLAIPVLRLPPEIILVEIVRRLVAPYVSAFLAGRRAIPDRPGAGA